MFRRNGEDLDRSPKNNDPARHCSTRWRDVAIEHTTIRIPYKSPSRRWPGIRPARRDGLSLFFLRRCRPLSKKEINNSMFSRVVYTVIRGIYALKSWFFVRLTGPGRLVLGGILASAVVGLDTEQTLAYQAFTFLTSIFLISMVWAKLSRPRARAHRILPRFGTVGEPLEYRVLLQNDSPHALKYVQLFEKPQHGNTGFGKTLRESDPIRAQRRFHQTKLRPGSPA